MASTLALASRLLSEAFVFEVRRSESYLPRKQRWQSRRENAVSLIQLYLLFLRAHLLSSHTTWLGNQCATALMAAASSLIRGGDESFPVVELVFSCSVCAATPSDVYKTSESNKGFHSGSGDDDGLVTKFWIADCSHLTCSTHLEGGGTWLHSACKDQLLTQSSRALPPKRRSAESTVPKMRGEQR